MNLWFIKRIFFVFGFVSLFSISYIDASFAVAVCKNTPKAGEFCKDLNVNDWTDVYNCRPGCYCTGGTTTSTSKNVKNACKDRDKDKEKSLNAAHIYFCPANYQNSEKGAKAITDCYNGDGVHYVEPPEEVPQKQNRRINAKCDSGKYLPANKTTCEACPFGCNCPGGKTYAYTSNEDRGIEYCEITRKCERGYYIEAGSTGCDYCPTGKYCPDYDIEYTVPLDYTVGAKDCPYGFEPNYDDKPPQFAEYCAEEENKNLPRCQYARAARSCKCIRDEYGECIAQINVPAGEYLRKNTTEPTNCVPNVNSKQYCPGGSFNVQNYDQGKYDCPFNADATSNHKACQLELTKEQLLNGVTGNGKCWLKTDPDDYKACIYGVRSN